ncbi:8833_t:CDS:1 [Ambispora gerdemannii]|uniref:8833_t:CDS:1 n=1 Tax=Ambispora gerdemannii TaxID=144530 RepID=A0A9N9GWA2_9GLOM|nr:8833_t:CDS:1 [Ambispora gerdemannii]
MKNPLFKFERNLNEFTELMQIENLIKIIESLDSNDPNQTKNLPGFEHIYKLFSNLDSNNNHFQIYLDFDKFKIVLDILIILISNDSDKEQQLKKLLGLKISILLKFFTS